MNSKLIIASLIILTIVFAGLYYFETERTKDLRAIVDQKNRAFLTLNSVTNGLIKLSNIPTDSLLSEISLSTQVLTKSSTTHVIGTTLENPKNYHWDFDVVEIFSDSIGRIQKVELFKQ